METYEQIKLKLEEQLLLSQKKIALLDGLKAEERAADLAESTILFKKQITSTGIIALMMGAKINSRREKGFEYDPFLLENKEDRAKFLNVLRRIDKNQCFDFNFVIGGRGTHATPVRIVSHNGDVIICSLDAGKMFPDNIPYIEEMGKALGVKPYIFIGGLQNSGYGCTMFSMHHLATMSNMRFDEIKEMFESATHEDKSNFVELKAKFVANIQSMSGINRYIESNPGAMISKKKSFVEHIAKHTRNTIELRIDKLRPDELEAGIIKSQNYALIYKAHKYLAAAYELFLGLNEEEVLDIVKRRTTAKIYEFEVRYIPSCSEAYEFESGVVSSLESDLDSAMQR